MKNKPSVLNVEALPVTVDNRPARAAQMGGLVLRSAIAAVPVLGGSVSVLVENHLSEQQRVRIDHLYTRLSQLEEEMSEVASAKLESSYSEPLLEYATQNAIQAQDSYRASVIANILYHLRGDDPHEIVRRFLIELAANLTQYELALLMNYSHVDGRDQSDISEFRKQLLEVHADGETINDVRQFSQRRLESYSLLNSAQNRPEATSMGEKLLSVL